MPSASSRMSLDAVICFGISRRRAGDEHHAFGGDSVLAQPTLDLIRAIILAT
jgi:hypothetical protein